MSYGSSDCLLVPLSDCLCLEGVDDVGDDTPEVYAVFFVKANGGVAGVFGFELDGVTFFAEAFDGQFSIDGGDDDTAIRGFEASVDDEEVSVVNASTNHGVSRGPDEEGGGGLLDEVLIEVEGSFEVIIGGGGEACGDARCIEGDGGFFVFYEAEDPINLADG